jgi:hypothetical protein
MCSLQERYACLHVRMRMCTTNRSGMRAHAAGPGLLVGHRRQGLHVVQRPRPRGNICLLVASVSASKCSCMCVCVYVFMCARVCGWVCVCVCIRVCSLELLLIQHVHSCVDAYAYNQHETAKIKYFEKIVFFCPKKLSCGHTWCSQAWCSHAAMWSASLHSCTRAFVTMSVCQDVDECFFGCLSYSRTQSLTHSLTHSLITCI